MVYLVLATAVAVLGFAFAAHATESTLVGLNQFSNAAGILSRVLTAVDAVRLVADWFVNRGAQGRGPLTVPAPVPAGARPTSSAGWSSAPGTRPKPDPYVDDLNGIALPAEPVPDWLANQPPRDVLFAQNRARRERGEYPPDTVVLGGSGPAG